MRVNGLWLAGMIMLFFFGAVLLNDRLGGGRARACPHRRPGRGALSV